MERRKEKGKERKEGKTERKERRERKREGKREKGSTHTKAQRVTVQDKNKKEKNGIVCPQR